MDEIIRRSIVHPFRTTRGILKIFVRVLPRGPSMVGRRARNVCFGVQGSWDSIPSGSYRDFFPEITCQVSPVQADHKLPNRPIFDTPNRRIRNLPVVFGVGIQERVKPDVYFITCSRRHVWPNAIKKQIVLARYKRCFYDRLNVCRRTELHVRNNAVENKTGRSVFVLW